MLPKPTIALIPLDVLVLIDTTCQLYKDNMRVSLGQLLADYGAVTYELPTMDIVEEGVIQDES